MSEQELKERENLLTLLDSKHITALTEIIQTLEILEAALEEMGEGIIITDNQGTVRYLNHTYASIRRIPVNEAIGKPISAIDRRKTFSVLLKTGELPSERYFTSKRRKNLERICLLRRGESIIGVMGIISEAIQGTELRTKDSLPEKKSIKSSWRPKYTFDDIIGRSPSIETARQLALKAAKSSSSILLRGESGTGKELFAHAIHQASPRMAFPFIPLHCPAIPKELLEAELFGYEPGAFTGASPRRKIGKIELSHQGTLFLDEIGDMPIDMQVKLLRVLEEKEIVRIGGIERIPVDFLLIAATNRNLEQLLVQGNFRQNLYYRLNGVSITIPPLRERQEDIPLLVEHLLERHAKKLGRVVQLSPEVMEILEYYPWPGNVRELINIIEWQILYSEGPIITKDNLAITASHILPRNGNSFSSMFNLGKVLSLTEHQLIKRVLEIVGSNREKASKLLGLSRATFYRKLERYKLKIGSGDPILP